MAKRMRAKLQVQSVTKYQHCDSVKFHGVPAKSYPPDGSDEDNTFAKHSPHVELAITIANPALIGAFEPGDVMYVDFTPVAA